MSARTKERRERIVTLAKQEGFVSVTALSQLFGVSEVTIRSDLDVLEAQAQLTRTHGGAFCNENRRPTLKSGLPSRVDRVANGAYALIDDYDAIMIAKAGVERLGIDLSEFYVEELEPMEFIPAPAQGVLAIQIRENDEELAEALKPLHHADVAREIGVERKVLQLFEGGCHMPLGCYCRKEDGNYEVWVSKAEDGEDFPDRLHLSASSSKGLAEEIVAKFDPNRKFPSNVFISRA